VASTRDDWDSRALLQLALLAGLSAVNRVDSLILLLPLLVYAAARHGPRRALPIVMAGLAPLFAWELFSIIYYGFPVPNTAYAKLPDAVPLGVRLAKGVGYLASSARFDPVAALVLACGMSAPLVFRARRCLPLAAGAGAYLLYALYVGGDFMAGRFFTAPMVLALAAAMRSVPAETRGWPLVPAAAAVALTLSFGIRSPLLTTARYGAAWDRAANIDARGVADERAVYYPFTGLLRAQQAGQPPQHPWFDEGRALPPGGVRASFWIGFTGFGAPRDAYIIDELGLADPLMARLPPSAPLTGRTGHLGRVVPPGYLETRRTGKNQLQNPALARYLDRLRLVAEGDLFTAERWRAIWELKPGRLDALRAHSLDVYVDAGALATPRRDGTRWDARGAVVLAAGATLHVRLDGEIQTPALLLSAGGTTATRSSSGEARLGWPRSSPTRSEASGCGRGACPYPVTPAPSTASRFALSRVTVATRSDTWAKSSPEPRPSSREGAGRSARLLNAGA
jgi:arabinofuranosyltransferase